MIDELSIIIPTLNEDHYLPKLLESISRQKFLGKLEVIVVDGESIDQTIEKAKTFKDKIPDLTIIKTKRGVGFQRNRGVELAKYKYLFFIDADIILPDHFLNGLTKKVKTDKDFIVSAVMWSTSKSKLDFLTLFLGYPLLFLHLIFDKVMPGGLTLTSKRLHKTIDGFKEGVVLGEDQDYGRKAAKSGAMYKFFLSPHAFHSPRRAREMGRIALLWYWWKAARHIRKHGFTDVNSNFPYPYGHYKGDD